MKHGGIQLQAWRQLVLVASWFSGFKILSSTAAYLAIFGQIRNRSLSDQANGVATIMRQDEQMVQTQSLWSLLLGVLLFLVVNETWHLLRTTNPFLPPEPKRVR